MSEYDAKVDSEITRVRRFRWEVDVYRSDRPDPTPHLCAITRTLWGARRASARFVEQVIGSDGWVTLKGRGWRRARPLVTES